MAQRRSTRARLTSAAPLTHYARKADAPQLSTLGPHSALPQTKTFASCISLDSSTKPQHLSMFSATPFQHCTRRQGCRLAHGGGANKNARDVNFLGALMQDELFNCRRHGCPLVPLPAKLLK